MNQINFGFEDLIIGLSDIGLMPNTDVVVVSKEHKELDISELAEEP